MVQKKGSTDPHPQNLIRQVLCIYESIKPTWTKATVKMAKVKVPFMKSPDGSLICCKSSQNVSMPVYSYYCRSILVLLLENYTSLTTREVYQFYYWRTILGLFMILTVVLVHGVIYGECQMLSRYDGLHLPINYAFFSLN